MNRIYKVIWSKARNCYVVVSEIAKTHSKGGTGVSGVVRKAGSAALLTAAVTAMLMTPLGTASAAAVDISSNSDGSATAVYQNSNNGIKIGDNTISASGDDSIAIGTNKTDAAGRGSVAIGSRAIVEAGASRGTAVGDSATATERDSSAYGSGAEASGTESTAIGHDSDASGTSAAAIGNAATASGADSFAAGYDSEASGGSSIAIGEQALGSGGSSTAVGSGSEATGQASTALGAGSDATATNSTATGSNAVASETNATAIGTSAGAKAEDSTALGSGAIADNTRAVALGGGGVTDPTTGEPSGNSAQAHGEDSIAIGSGSRTAEAAASSVAIGGGGEDQGANAAAEGAVAVGTGTSASGVNSVAIGGGDEKDGANASADGAVALGNNSKATVENGVALGAGSIANVDAAEEPGFIPNPKTYITYDDNPIWQSNEAAVSIGNPDGSMTRQITGVAAGTNDWDAANVAQLKAAMTHYYSVNTTKETDEEGNNNYANDGATGNNALAAGVKASAQGENDVAVGYLSTTDGNKNQTAVGNNSHVSGGADSQAFGSNATVSGAGSTAVGVNTHVSSSGSQAIGNDATVDGSSGGSTAVGTGTHVSSGSASQAFGNNATVYGSSSTAVGSNVHTSGSDSQAFGYNATVSGSYATAIGYDSHTSNSYATAVGSSVSTGSTNSAIVGYSSSIDSSSEGANLFGKSSSISYSSGGLALGNNVSLSSASGSTAVGSQTGVSGSSGSAALGTSSHVSGGGGSTAVGNSVNISSSSGAAAFGTGSSSTTTINNSSGSMSFGGYNTISGGAGVTAVGIYTNISGSSGAIAMGNYSSMSGSTGSILIGENSSSISSSYGSTAIGSGVHISSGSGSFVFGDESSISSDSGSMLLGNSSSISGGSGSHLLGNQSTISGGSGGSLIGNSSSLYANGQILGNQSTIDSAGSGGGVFGNASSVKANAGRVIGNSSNVIEGSNGSIVVGNSSTIKGGSSGSFLIGESSTIEGGSGGSYLIGDQTTITSGSSGSQAFGGGAYVSSSGGATALGNQTRITSSGGSQAIGVNASVTNGGGDAAIGNGAKVASSGGATALGNGASVTSSGGSQALGQNSVVTNSGGATAVGTGAVVTGSDNGLAMGARAVATGGWAATAIGTDATTTISQGVALGSNALADIESGKTGYNPLWKSQPLTPEEIDSSTWTSTAAAVSVGGKTFTYAKTDADGNYINKDGDIVETAAEAEQITKTYTRQIANVAAGTEDTDAVNVAQLKKVVAEAAGSGDHYFGADDANNVELETAGPVSENKITRIHNQQVNVIGDSEYTATEVTARVSDGVTYTEKEGQWVDKDGNVLPEDAEYTEKQIKQAELVKEGNIKTSIGEDKFGIQSVKVELNRDLEVDSIMVTGKDGKEGEPGTPGTIGINGRDGTNGLPGEDGETTTRVDIQVGPSGEPGLDGKDGVTRIIYKDGDGDHEVATLDDGLKFGANAGEPVATEEGGEEEGPNPVPNKLNSTVNIVGSEAVEGREYSTENLTTTVGQAEDGTTTITVKMDKDPNFDTLIVNGKDGKDGEPGTPGKIGIRGEPGEDGTPGEVAYISVTNDGTPGVDGKDGEDGITRIVYTDPKDPDKPIEVATLDDGMKYSGDFGNTKDNPVAVKLNKNVDVVGNSTAASADDLTDGNIGVVAEPETDEETGEATGNAKLTIKLNKDINLGTDGSLTVGGEVDEEGNPKTDEYGNPTSIVIGPQTVNHVDGSTEEGDFIVGLDNTNWDPTNIVSGRAATEDQLAAAQTHYYSVNDNGTRQDNWLNDGATGINSLAAGTNAKASGITSTAVGHNANASVMGAVALGSNSVADRPAATESGYDVTTGTNYDRDDKDSATWKATTGALSLGGTQEIKTKVEPGTPGAVEIDGEYYLVQTVETTRQITGVAAGLEDTDAVNVAQLKRLENAMQIHDYSVNSVEPGKDLNYDNKGATGDNAMAAGVNAIAEAENATAVGNMAIARNKNSTAVGNMALASADSAAAFGDNAQATIKDSVAIGSNALTTEVVGTENITVAGTTYDFAGTKPVGTVSVGQKDQERTITHVAAGRISDTSTDAINGSQLYAMAKAIDEVDSRHTTVSVGGVAAEKDDTPVEGGNLTLERSKNENGAYNYDVKLARDLDVDTIVVNGKDGAPGEPGLTIKGQDGAPGAIGIAGEDGEIKIITITENGEPGVDGKDGITRIIIDDKPVATLDDGMKYAGDFGDGAAVKLNKTVNVVGEAKNEDDLTTGNIGVVAEQDGEDGKLTIKLNKDINLGDTGSITMGDVHIHDGDEISFGGNQIHNVAAGEDDYDVVNVSQLKQFTAAAKTEVSVGDVRVTEDGTPVTGGNLELKRTKDTTDGHEIYDVRLSDNVELGGPGKDGADGKDGSIGVNGADGKSGVGIDGKDGITVYGKDGKDGEPAVAINGKDGVGHIGLAGPAGKDGKDGISDIHMIWGEPIVGKDGAPGTDGITRIEYTDPEGNPHQVATTDDGLYFGANTGDPNPAPNRINSRVNIMGAGTKDDDSYSGENLKTIISQTGEGKDAVTTINVVMDKDLNVDTIAVNGKDGKDGTIGINGRDGTNGKDGTNRVDIQVGPSGEPGLDGKDGVTRIIYEDGDGEHEVATLDDGMKYSGDFGNTKDDPVPVKLNNNVDIVGNSTAASEDELSDGNIGVVAKPTEDGGAQLVVKLNKNIDLTEEGSVTMGDTVINNEGLTINNGGPEGDIVINKGDVSFGGNVIHNVAPGVEDTDVVNVSQLKEVEQLASQHSTVTVDGSPIDENVTDGNLLLTVTKEEGKGTNYDLKLNDNIELGGPGKDGKDGVDGSIGVNGADGKSGVGIDGKDGISVRGTDGKDGVTIYAKNGEDGKDGSEGHIGLAGKNGKDGKDGVTDIYTKWGDPTPGTYGKDGKDGTDGITRIVYTDPEGDEHQVATMDDGLKFGANSGDPNPAVNKLSSTVEIKGAGEKDDDNYTGKNLKTIISQEGEGKDAVTTINVVMDKDLETETLVVNGKDGKDGEPGQAGHIGIDGKDGEAGIGIDGKDGITITGKDGKDGVSIKGVDGKDGTEGRIGLAGRDGKDAEILIGKGYDGERGEKGANGVDGLGGEDGITRIIYQDPDGTEHQVATMDDGMKYTGDFGDGAAVKLNNTVNVVGEAKNEEDLTTGNIGVVAAQDGDNGKLTVKLNKDIDLGDKGSVKMGDTKINNEGLTINEGPSVTKNGIDAGSKKITNVAPGEADTDAVNVSQLKDFQGDVNQSIGDVNNRINRLGDRVDKVGAGAAALAGLHPLDFDPDAKWDVAAGYGHYRGENAVAVGAFYRPSEDVMVNVASTVGNGDNMISAGVSVKVGGNTHVSNSRVALSKQVLEMRKEIEDMRSLMADSAFGKQLDLSKLQLFPDTPENHWAYDYVATLAGNGLLEGYPDGNFRGDRALTRYEVAAILYRAMLNGAQLTQRALEEFAPELDRIRVDTLTRHSDGTPSIQRVRIIKDRR